MNFVLFAPWVSPAHGRFSSLEGAPGVSDGGGGGGLGAKWKGSVMSMTSQLPVETGEWGVDGIEERKDRGDSTGPWGSQEKPGLLRVREGSRGP